MKKHMLIEAEIWTVARTDKGNAVLIRPLNSDLVVPIFIGQLEAQAILIGLGKVPMPRPLTHDLFAEILHEMSASLQRIEIVDLRDGTFIQIWLSMAGKTRLLLTVAHLMQLPWQCEMAVECLLMNPSSVKPGFLLP